MAKPDFQLKWGVNRVGGIPTTDPADYQLGWQYRNGLPPLTGNFDYFQNLADDRLLYLNAQGIPEWDALTAYDTDAYVKGSDGELYRSTAPTTGNDPTLGGPWSSASATDYLNTVRQDVVSAATTVLPDTTRHVNITGAAAITAFTIAEGNCYFVRFDGAVTLTNNASIVTQTGSNIVAAAGDTCLLRATATDVVEVLTYTQNPSNTASLSASGWQRLPSGLIIQWGSFAHPGASAIIDVILPISFTTWRASPIAIRATGDGNFDANSVLTTDAGLSQPFPLASFKAKYQGSGRDFSYICIGQ